MHPVDVGVRRDNDLVVTKAVESVLDVEGGLQQVELLVLIDHFFGQAVAIERFAAQREHGLGIYVAALGDGTAR